MLAKLARYLWVGLCLCGLISSLYEFDATLYIVFFIRAQHLLFCCIYTEKSNLVLVSTVKATVRRFQVKEK